MGRKLFPVGYCSMMSRSCPFTSLIFPADTINSLPLSPPLYDIVSIAPDHEEGFPCSQSSAVMAIQ